MSATITLTEVVHTMTLKVPRPSIPQTNYVPARRKVICFSGTGYSGPLAISSHTLPTIGSYHQPSPLTDSTDFDGTIFMQDTGHVLFDRHGCGISRREILEKQINTGERSFKEVSEEMWGSVRIPFEASFELMKSNLEIDPDFRSFHE